MTPTPAARRAAERIEGRFNLNDGATEPVEAEIAAIIDDETQRTLIAKAQMADELANTLDKALSKMDECGCTECVFCKSLYSARAVSVRLRDMGTR